MKTESLDYYWKLAKKIIAVHGYTKLLKDNENIGFVANALMNADIDFKPEIGVLEGYRSMHAKFAIKKIIKKQKKKKNTVSLSDKFDSPYSDNYQSIVDCEEMLDFIRDKDIVSEDVLEQIKDRFMHDYSWGDIAEKHGITKQAAKLNVKHGLSDIKRVLCT